MINILEQLKEAQKLNKSEFKLKLNPEYNAIELFAELKKFGHNPSLEEENNDLYLVVPIQRTKVINLFDYQPKPKILSIEDNVIRVNFGRVS